MEDLGPELYRIDAETDLRTVRELRRYHDRQRLRRPPKRSDRYWVGLVAVVGLVGWIIAGRSWIWFLALAIAGLYALGELREWAADRRVLASTPIEARARALSFHEHGLRLQEGDGARRLGWRDLDEVRRLESAYLVLFRDRSIAPMCVPYEHLGSPQRSGRLEALLAAHDRLVQDE